MAAQPDHQWIFDEICVDILHLDWPLPRLPIDALPNEILFGIARYLCQHHLPALAQVSKKFLDIVRDVIYRDISLFPFRFNYSAGYSSISGLIWTFTHCPALTQKVRCLAMTATPHRYVLYMDHFPAFESNSAVPAFPKDTMVQDSIVKLILAGYLLTLLPRLRKLKLVIPTSGTTEVNQPIVRMFNTPTTANVKSIIGLANLESLEISAGTIDASLLELPRLKHITLTNTHSICSDRPLNNSSFSNVNSLSLVKTTNLLKLGGGPTRRIPQKLLHTLPQLRSLTIHLSLRRWRELLDGPLPSWQNLVTKLANIYGVLEELEYLPLFGYGPSWLGSVAPVTDLTHLTQLQKSESPRTPS